MKDNCEAPQLGRDPDCDHESDPVERALYIVADSVARHTMSGKWWGCNDSCWLEDLARARAILEEWKSA